MGVLNKEANDVLSSFVLKVTLPATILNSALRDMEMGRKEIIEYDSEGNRIYHDRIIDIDILLYGDRTIEESDLIVPHPRMKEREFVMKPLSEISSKVF